jgi:hypothetical protein
MNAVLQYTLSQAQRSNNLTPMVALDLSISCDMTQVLFVGKHFIEFSLARALSDQSSEEHDTTTCPQEDLQFRFRNLPKSQVTALRQERDVFII